MHSWCQCRLRVSELASLRRLAVSIERRERYNPLSLNDYLLDIFSHRLLVAQRHVFFPFLLFVQAVVHNLIGLVHNELMLFNVLVGAYSQRLHHDVDVLEFKMRHAFEQPVKLGGTFSEIKRDCHVDRVVGLLESLEDRL